MTKGSSKKGKSGAVDTLGEALLICGGMNQQIWARPPKIQGDGEMMDDEDNSSRSSRWSRVRDRILGAYSDHVRAQGPPEQPNNQEVASYAAAVTTTDNNSVGNWYWTDEPGKVVPVDDLKSLPGNWTISYPQNEPLPYTARCNYCGMETVDYRELRIGRMTKVVVCDICMLKTINSILGEPRDKSKDNDSGSDGD